MNKQNAYENLPDKYKEPEIRLINSSTDLSKLKLEKLDWDINVSGEDKDRDVYKIQGYVHATGGSKGTYDLWACPRNEKPTVDNLTAWCGFYGARWGFSVNPQNYCKYKWANTSIENNIKVLITRNDLVFDEFFANTMLYAATEVSSRIIQYQEFCISLDCQNFENQFINMKVFWKDQPAVVTSYVSTQACVMLKPEEGFTFTKPIYLDKEDCWDEKEEIKSEILSTHIWWFRN